MTTEKELMKRLGEAFPEENISFRIGSTWQKDGKLMGRVHAYIEARDVMTRLDEVVGPGNWKKETTPINIPVPASELAAMLKKDGTKGPIALMLENGIIPMHSGYIVTLSVRIGDEWVTKDGVAQLTDYEALKGGESDALKRAAVQFGTGRYLYYLPRMIVRCERRGRTSYIAKDEMPRLRAMLRKAAKQYFSSQNPAVISEEEPKNEEAPEPEEEKASSAPTEDIIAQIMGKRSMGELVALFNSLPNEKRTTEVTAAMSTKMEELRQ